MMRTKDYWENVYRKKATPWDAKAPEPHVVQFVEQGIIRPCKAIDLGCGAGNEAIFLVQHGFTVTAVDIAAEAIAEARRRATAAGVKCNFIIASVLEMPLDQRYDFALDRACFHFLNPEEHPRYLHNVRTILNPGAWFLLFASSDYETAKGPYQFSKEDIKRLFSGDFTIDRIELVTLETHGERPRPYMCLLKRK